MALIQHGRIHAGTKTIMSYSVESLPFQPSTLEFQREISFVGQMTQLIRDDILGGPRNDFVSHSTLGGMPNICRTFIKKASSDKYGLHSNVRSDEGTTTTYKTRYKNKHPCDSTGTKCIRFHEENERITMKKEILLKSQGVGFFQKRRTKRLSRQQKKMSVKTVVTFEILTKIQFYVYHLKG